MTFTCRSIVAALALGLIASLGGCSSAQTGSKGDYVKDYESGRYTEAYDAASKQATQGPAAKRDQAALIAGLSAQALNRDDEAVKYLSQAVENPDPKICGEAGAALGLIASERGDHLEAAEQLAKAGGRLQGDNAARAYMYSGDAYKSLGKTTEAKAMWSLAQTKVEKDAGLRVMIGDRLAAASKPPTPPPATAKGPVRFTVQVGAFSSYTNAQQQLARFRAYGSPRVVEITDKQGRKLFAVRVGSFATRPEADQVKNNIGKEAVITTTAGE